MHISYKIYRIPLFRFVKVIEKRQDFGKGRLLYNSTSKAMNLHDPFKLTQLRNKA